MISFKKKFADLLELPQDIVLDLPKLVVIGDIQLTVENHRGIIEYCPKRVVIGTVGGQLAVSGEDLSIGCITAEQITITGKLTVLEFSR